MGHFYIVSLNNYLIHLAHRSIDNWCYWSNHKVCIQSCWDVVFVIALFAMYHRKIMAFLVLSTTSPLSICFIF